MNTRRRAGAIVGALACLVGSPALAAHLSGRVLDRAGQPIEFANVRVPAMRLATTTDEDGRFTLEVPDGRVELEFIQIGYQRARRVVDAAEGLAPLQIALAEEPVPVAEVSVATSSFGNSGHSEGAVVRRMDVYTTPGGAADVFQALRALPGINAPNEGAALYVRGGDPSETLIRIDGGDVGHPYHYEGASGGLFSAFDTYMLKSAFFSSGGFGSKYGGAMSGVLDIETQDPLNLKTVNVGANLAGGGVSSSWALLPNRLSLIATLRHSWPEVLFRLYGTSRDYESAPSSTDGAAKLLWRFRPTGRASLLYLGSGDAVAVHADLLNSSAVLSARGRTDFVAAQVSDVVAGRLVVRTQVSGQRYTRTSAYNAFAQRREEHNAQAGVDASWPMGPRNELGLGAVLHRPDARLTGSSAADSTDLGASAPVRVLDAHANGLAPGFWIEDKLRLFGPLYATLGGRVDRVSASSAWTADPRAALAWRLDAHQTLRLAAGRYHQLPDVSRQDPVYGNPDLGPLRADHVIAGWEWLSDQGNVRIEGFRKSYHGLVTQDSTRFYANDGTGRASGIDVFVHGTYRWLSGWVSYGYLDARRRELDDPREVPSTYGVPHAVTLVAEYSASSKLMLGARWSHNTGSPYTAVVGRRYDGTRDLWRPIYGEHNAARVPDYDRLDVRLSRLFSLPAGAGLRASSVCVAYVEAMNALHTPNLLREVWNSDYSRRSWIDTYFSRRLLVAGVSLSW